MPDEQIRYCTHLDWNSMSRLRMGRKTHAGAPVNAFTSTLISTVPTIYQAKPNIAVGKWLDGKLVAFICASSGDDFWVLDLMVSSGDPKLLRGCLSFCIDHFESVNIQQFYYAFPEKWARAYRSFWKDGISSLRRYHIEDCCVIEGRRIPSSKFIWESILHECVVPVPFLVRRSYVPK